jgi:hypothetical protein
MRPVVWRNGRGGPGLHQKDLVFVATTDTSAETHRWFRRCRHTTKLNQTRESGDVFDAPYVCRAPGCGDAARTGVDDALLRPLQGHIHDTQVTLRSQLLSLEERLPPAGIK